ncbi:carboxypeptidase inhibitor SmCI-like [Crassostrea angulata]|uniref:carboxypeptidase inhibitor SmCI-like n=1 Tax=Magallana angulata TaxID=2784310 RepID=UPI0022B171E5|nr:carboxypeptidase inhibitor SmCI-like [Crassostrea angulata]
MVYKVLFFTWALCFADGVDEVHPSGEECSAIPERGPCKGSCPRYHFDPSDYKCKQFTYGCCGGNSNSYLTQQACLNACNDGCPDGTNPDQIRCLVDACTYEKCPRFPEADCVSRCNGCVAQFINKHRDVTSICQKKKNKVIKKKESCSAEPDPGPCEGLCPRYYYDQEDSTCKKFTYGCCEGNSNNYKTLEECLDGCNDGCPNGTNFKEIECKEKACTTQTCPNYPQAKCIPRCNSCVSQFIYKGHDVTSQCNTKG